MAESNLLLQHCDAVFGEGPEIRLTLKCNSVKVQLSNWGVKRLMRILPTVVSRVREAEARGLTNAPDEILNSFVLMKSNSNCVKLESKIYKGAAYVFIKSYFLDKNRGKWGNLSSEGELELVRDELCQEFEQVLETIEEKNPGEGWVPRTCPIRLEMNDIETLRNFILDRYKKIKNIQ